jgi:hypothetical protein
VLPPTHRLQHTSTELAAQDTHPDESRTETEARLVALTALIQELQISLTQAQAEAAQLHRAPATCTRARHLCTRRVRASICESVCVRMSVCVCLSWHVP